LGSFHGTPIGPHHFITAAHLGGPVGELFSFHGVDYTTIATWIDSASDLEIWEVAEAFPTWAELYDGPTETGADLVVFGRGSIRGAEVRLNGALKGWQWAASDGRLRWGRNTVASITNDPNHSGSDQPQLLVAGFNSNATADEVHLGGGDSGGGVFIQQNNTWRLAGINYAVEGPYKISATGDPFQAAIFDDGGLYHSEAADIWLFTPDLPTDQPGSFFATRIKARLPWIQSVLALPLWPVLVEASTATGPYKVVRGATIDRTAKTIQFTPAEGSHFFQIQNIATTITSIELNGGALTLRYQ
jgi:hypothetical protein